MAQALKGRVAVVTGGSSGIGRAICEAYLAEGALVTFTGHRDQAEIDAIAAEMGLGAEGRRVDAGNPGEMDQLLRDVRDLHGRLDVLVANAGIGRHARLGTITEAQFDETIRTNLKGVLFATQSAVPLMDREGSLIWIGSTAGDAPPPGMSVYSGAKAALRAMMESLVQELVAPAPRINLLSPGTVDTQSLRGAFARANGEDGVEAAIASITKRSPMRRIGGVDEVAAVAVFLAGDGASYVNGTEIFVDGGLRQAG